MMMEGEPGERHQEILAVKDDGGSAVWRIILHFQATDGLSQEQVDYYKDIFSVFDRQVVSTLTSLLVGDKLLN